MTSEQLLSLLFGFCLAQALFWLGWWVGRRELRRRLKAEQEQMVDEARAARWKR